MHANAKVCYIRGYEKFSGVYVRNTYRLGCPYTLSGELSGLLLKPPGPTLALVSGRVHRF